jgi:uncharacterized membrane protein
MTPAQHLRARGDLFLCLAVGILLALATVGGWSGASAPGAWKQIEPALGCAMLLLPGYAGCILVGLDRRGIETLAGAGVALSLAILALTGTMLWLLTHTLSIRALTALLATVLVSLTTGALWRLTRRRALCDTASTRWAALGVIVLPLAITVAMIGWAPAGPPATRYTEFYIAATRPTLTYAVVNREDAPVKYRMTARLDSVLRQTQVFTLRPGQRWQAEIPMSERQSGLIRLYLRVGDRATTMKLWVWLPALQSHILEGRP